MAERPNYTGGRTVMTAPIRAAQVTPEQDAPRATGRGLEAFGQGLASVGGSLNQMGQMKRQQERQDARKAEALEKERMSNGRQIAANILDDKLIQLQKELAGDKEYQDLDDNGRAPVLDERIRQVQEGMAEVYKTLGINGDDPLLASAVNERISRMQFPQIAQGADLRFGRIVAADFSSRINRFSNIASEQQDFSSLKGMHKAGMAEVTGLPDSIQSPENRQRLLDRLGGSVKAQADWLAASGLLTKEEIADGLKEGMWNGSEATTLLNRIAAAEAEGTALVNDNYNEMLARVRSGQVSAQDALYSPEVQAKGRMITKRGKGDTVATNTSLNAMGREIQLAGTAGRLNASLINNRGLSDGPVTWRKVQDVLTQLSEPEGRRAFFAEYTKDGSFGEYTDAELAATASEVSTNYTKWMKEIEAGQAHVKFSNDVRIQKFVRDNPDWQFTEGGWQAYTKEMRKVQEAAGIPSQYISPVPMEVMNKFRQAATKPEQLGDVLRRAMDRDLGLGKEMGSLIQGLSADSEFMKTSNGQTLVGGLVPVAMAMNMEPNDKNIGTVMEMTAALAQTVNFLNQGGEKTFDETIPNGRATLQSVSTVMSSDLAQKAGKIRLTKDLPLYAEGLDTYNNLMAGVGNTFTPEVALAVSRAITFDAMRRAGGSSSRLIHAYAESYSAMTAGMKVLIANGTQRADSSKDYIVVPASSEPRGTLQQPGGTTIGVENTIDYGTTTSLTLDALSSPSHEVFAPFETAPLTVAAMTARLPTLIPTAAAVDYFRGNAPWGALESMWNSTKAGFAQNWLGVSVENSRTPALSMLNADPDLMKAIPSVFRPDAATLAIMGMDDQGNERMIHVSTSKPFIRSKLGEVRQDFTDAVQGYSTAKDRDLRALTVAQNITWRYNKSDDTFYAFLKPGKSNDGQIILPVTGAAPQQLYHVVDGAVIPMGVPKAVVDKLTSAKEARSGSFMSSVVSPLGSGMALAQRVVAAGGMMTPNLSRVERDNASLKAWLDQQAEVFVGVHQRE